MLFNSDEYVHIILTMPLLATRKQRAHYIVVAYSAELVSVTRAKKNIGQLHTCPEHQIARNRVLAAGQL